MLKLGRYPPKKIQSSHLKFPVVQHATTIVCQISWPVFVVVVVVVFFFGRVRVLAVKLQGNFKTFPSLSQAERLCSSSAKTLCALMIPLTTTTDCYYGFCYALLLLPSNFLRLLSR